MVPESFSVIAPVSFAFLCSALTQCPAPPQRPEAAQVRPLILLLAAVPSTDGTSVFPLAEERTAKWGSSPWHVAPGLPVAVCTGAVLFPDSSQCCSTWREGQSDGPNPCKWKNFKSWRRAEREKLALPTGPCAFSPLLPPSPLPSPKLALQCCLFLPLR